MLSSGNKIEKTCRFCYSKLTSQYFFHVSQYKCEFEIYLANSLGKEVQALAATQAVVEVVPIVVEVVPILNAELPEVPIGAQIQSSMDRWPK